MKPTLLWVGDATVASGFAEITHNVLHELRDGWELQVLGLNYDGDPHAYPFLRNRIWPASVNGTDYLGLNRIGPLINAINPDVIVLQNDGWNIPYYIKAIRKVNKTIPIVGAIAVDGKNVQGVWLEDLTFAIFWTKFAENEARLGGYVGPSAVIPLGVDLELYSPMNRKRARQFLAFPKVLEDGFIVGTVNRNQPRKRLDLTVSYFAQWAKDFDRRDAYLYIHVAPTGDQGWNLEQLMHYYGFRGANKRLIVDRPDVGYGVHPTILSVTYSTFNTQLSTAIGEGWHLPTMEGMACGVVPIVGDQAGLAEWTEDAAIKVPCSEIQVTPGMANIICGVPDRAAVIEALEQVYNHGAEDYIKRGLELVSRPEFRWKNIGKRYDEVLKEVVARAGELPLFALNRELMGVDG